jgi:hypothetical protein
VAGAREIGRLRLRIDGGQDRRCAVGGGDAGRHATSSFDGDCKGRAEERSVVGDLHREVQFVAAFFG